MMRSRCDITVPGEIMDLNTQMAKMLRVASISIPSISVADLDVVASCI